VIVGVLTVIGCALWAKPSMADYAMAMVLGTSLLAFQVYQRRAWKRTLGSINPFWWMVLPILPFTGREKGVVGFIFFSSWIIAAVLRECFRERIAHYYSDAKKTSQG